MNKQRRIKRIINRVSNLEYKISKLENRVRNKENISNDLKVLRDILNTYDEYMLDKNPDTMVLRHYRYCTFDVDKLEDL